MEKIVTNDFSDFGYCEKEEARELMSAYGTDKDKTVYLGSGVQVWFNLHSGYVFLSDEDFNSAMMNGDVLEDFINCPECGHEDFLSEMKESGDACCKKYFFGSEAI